MIYVTSDIHGCYYTFKELLDKISFSDYDKIICLGDTIDRGKHNLSLLSMFMENPDMILIKGNHEFFFELCISRYLSQYDWASFGGDTTMKELNMIPQDKIIEYYNFIEQLPLYYEHGDYIMSHNGFNSKFPFIKDKNDIINVKETINAQWAHDPYNFIISSDIHRKLSDIKLDKKLIVGHYPTPFLGSKRVLHGKNCINVDCGATYPNGHLGCLCLDTMQDFYIDIDNRDI